MSDNNFNLLMTCVGGALMPQNILSAQNSSKHMIRVIGVDASENPIGRHFVNKYYQIPLADDPDYIEKMLTIVKKENVDLIIPGSDEESLILAKHRADFEAENAQIANADYETLTILNDKSKTYHALKNVAGINEPLWYTVHTLDELMQRVQSIYDVHGAAVIKPSLERGSRGITVLYEGCKDVKIMDGVREIHMTLKEFKQGHFNTYQDQFPVVVMQRLIDPVHDVDLLSMKGEAFHIIPRCRIHSAAPNSGHMLVDNPKLIEMGEIIIKHFNLSWLQDIDVMFDENGAPFILEINPRPSGSYAISVAAGYPIIDDMVSLTKGEPLSRIDINSHKKILPYTSLKVSEL